MNLSERITNPKILGLFEFRKLPLKEFWLTTKVSSERYARSTRLGRQLNQIKRIEPLWHEARR